MDRAPWAFCCGALLGALWPFATFYGAWLFRSGATLGVEGPQNWADTILAFGMILSYGGCFTLFLLGAAVGVGFFVGGYAAALAAILLRSR